MRARREAASQPSFRSMAAQKVAVVGAAGFEFQEFAIGAALLFQIAERGDVAVFEDQHLVAALFHVAQQVRGERSGADRRGRGFPE
jgi:hypothetical protein